MAEDLPSPAATGNKAYIVEGVELGVATTNGD